MPIFGGASKLKKLRMVKVKPLADRKRLGGGNAEKIMGSLEDLKKTRIKAEQSLNKMRMGRDEKRKPMKSDAKDDIRIARDVRKSRAKTNKEAAVGAVAAGTATGGALYATDKVLKKKKAKKTEGMEKRVKKAKGGKVLKPVDKNKNPGLAKLPTQVRNKMGYMKDGGMVKVKRIQLKGFGKARH